MPSTLPRRPRARVTDARLTPWTRRRRDLTRTHKRLVREIARHKQRLQKTLDDANVKLTCVITDILGVSGRAILMARIAGETDPERLADCTNVRVKADRADIVAAAHGRVTPHLRFLLDPEVDQDGLGVGHASLHHDVLGLYVSVDNPLLVASGQSRRDFPNAPDCLVHQKRWRLLMRRLCPLPPSVERASSLADVPGIRRVGRPVPQSEDRAMTHPFAEYRQLAAEPLLFPIGRRSQFPTHAGASIYVADWPDAGLSA